MDPAKRIIINTGMQYVKAVITTCLTLYSTRLILDALNVSDYGIYSVIAGVVAMLGFITNALIITTQRYLSFYQATEEVTFLQKLFTNSLFIHLLIGVAIGIILLAVQGVLFRYVLNIEASRVPAAEVVYVITVFMLFITILTSPFKALLIAHENIVYIAVVEIMDSVIKLALAIGLAYVTFDRLLFYAGFMALILCINLVVFCVYALVKYAECTIIIRRRNLDVTHIKNMTGFAGWTTYGAGCVAVRSQGTAVVLNHFWGTTINAAYGIAFQISSAISFLVTSILNAMNPQLMQAEGKGRREEMLNMAACQSKFSVAILSIVLIPLIAEMPGILDLWLTEVPENTTMFCRFILLAFLCDQITLGLSSANQAIGEIRNFTLITYTPKLLYIVIIWLMFQYGCSVRAVMMLYVSVELGVALIRIPYMKYKANLNMVQYAKNVLLPVFLQGTAIFAACWLCISFYTGTGLVRLILTTVLSILVGGVTGWLFVLNRQEKTYMTDMIRRMFKI